jgi:hypothetical protein
MRIRTTAAAAASLLAGAAASYPLLWRERCLTWGATRAEAELALPGDELLAKPDVVSTRAITINAPASAIWPWLVQMGSGRGGVYTYDWIENLLGLRMHSASEILPQFQDTKLGDELPLGDTGKSMRVLGFDPRHTFTIGLPDHSWIWIFALLPAGAGTTRLISRNRIAMRDTSMVARLFSMLIMEPGSLVMERKMLLGIKERAERLARDRDRDPARGQPARGKPARAQPASGEAAQDLSARGTART